MTKTRKIAVDKYLKNLLKFTAPILASFFLMLSQGVPVEKAWPVLLVAFWGALADYLKKLS